MVKPKVPPRAVSLPTPRAKARERENQSRSFRVLLSVCLVVWKAVGQDHPRERICVFRTIWVDVLRKLRTDGVDVVSMFVVPPSAVEIIQQCRVTSCRRRTARTEVFLFPPVMTANE